MAEFVVGIDRSPVHVKVFAGGTTDSPSNDEDVLAGIGIDTVSANSAVLYGHHVTSTGVNFSQTPAYIGHVGIGYHYLHWVEKIPGNYYDGDDSLLYVEIDG